MINPFDSSIPNIVRLLLFVSVTLIVIGVTIVIIAK